MPRRSRSDAPGLGNASHSGSAIEDDDGNWDFEESGIAEVPPEFGDEHASGRLASDSGRKWRMLEQALAENERLRAVQAQLRRERDQAVRTAWSVRRELSAQIETTQREVSHARAQAATLDRLRRESAQKYGGTLHRLQRQIADLREQLSAFEGMLSAVTRNGTRPRP